MSSAVDADAARGHLVRACALGGAVAAVGFTWMLAIGRLDLLQSGVLSGVYDAQAHRLLAGHWDVPVSKLAFEAFLVHGKTYMYFGPWPAVLRVPIAAVTDRLDGRLTQPSMLAAFAVLLVATSRLLSRVRQLARGAQPVTRTERWAAAVFVVVVGTGSVVMFLASRPVVYHEVELWGAALSLAAYDATLGFIIRPHRRALAWAGVLGGLALLSRGSVGIGPVVALGLVLLGRLLTVVARGLRRPEFGRPVRWLGLGDEPSNRGYVVPLAVAVAVPAALYMYVNYVKFGHPWNLPITRQLATFTDPIRQSVFAHNNGKLFGLKFVPTNLLAMLRPDALGLDRFFPWVTFPSRATLVGGVQFAARDPSSSIPASMPFLFILTFVGIVAVFHPRRREASGLSALRVPVLGALAGGVGAITIPFINQRYVSDFIPLMVLLAVAGLHALLRRVDEGAAAALPTDAGTPELSTATRKRSTTKAVKRLAAVAFVALAAYSIWVNFALAILYQRAYSPFSTEAERAAFVRFQYDLDESLTGGSRTNVRAGTKLPDPLPAGTVFVLGQCDGVYWSDGSAWHPIQRTHQTGRFPLDVSFRHRRPGTRETLLNAGPVGAQDRLGIEYLARGRVRFWFSSPRLGKEIAGPQHTIRPGRTTRLEIDYDAALGNLDVELDDESVLGLISTLTPGPIAVAGNRGADANVDFSGDARLEPTPRGFCAKVAPEEARVRHAR